MKGRLAQRHEECVSREGQLCKCSAERMTIPYSRNNRSPIWQESRECQTRSKLCLFNLSPAYPSEELRSSSTIKQVWETPGSSLPWDLKGSTLVYQQSASLSCFLRASVQGSWSRSPARHLCSSMS